MAAIYAPPAPPAPEPTSDPLREELVQYITKGQHAVHTTNAEFDRMLEATITQPGGKAYLESLPYVEKSSQDTTLWDKQEPVIGTVELTKIRANLSLHVPALKRKFEGSVSGFFVPDAELLRNGVFSYNHDDAFKDGHIDIKIQVCGVDFRVDFYRGGDRVANMTFRPVGFYMHQGQVIPGEGDWSESTERHHHQSAEPVQMVGVAA